MSTYEHVCGACGRPDTPRVWRSGDDEPGEDVLIVMDRYGWVWEREEDGWGRNDYPWDELLPRLGPLVEVMLPAPVLW